MHYFVYILLSTKDSGLYVGCTKNIQKRIQAHNSGKVLSTRSRRPLVVIHQEKYLDKSDAFQRERFLKTLWSAREKKKILKKYLDKIGRNN
jgi:putative endonuclease